MKNWNTLTVEHLTRCGASLMQGLVQQHRCQTHEAGPAGSPTSFSLLETLNITQRGCLNDQVGLNLNCIGHIVNYFPINQWMGAWEKCQISLWTIKTLLSCVWVKFVVLLQRHHCSLFKQKNWWSERMRDCSRSPRSLVVKHVSTLLMQMIVKVKSEKLNFKVRFLLNCACYTPP